MSEIEFPTTEILLDRTRVPNKIDRDLSQHVDYLATLADWGVQFQKRCIERADEAAPATIVLITTLYRQVLAFLDSLHLHLNAGAVHASIPSLRALYEATLSIEWILENGKEHWSQQYYVSELRQRRSWLATVVPGTSEYEEAVDFASSELLEALQNAEHQQAAEEEVENIDQHFSANPKMAEINAAFDELKEKKHGREPDWYEPGGPNSLADMASRLDREEEYRILYRQWSEVAHGSRTRGHVQVQKEEGRLVLEPIRSVENLDQVFRIAHSLGERATRMLLEEFNPGKLDLLSKKITEEWAEQRQMPNINVRQEVVEGF